MQGIALNENPEIRNSELHKVETDNDIMKCNELSIRAHGFTREGELRQAVSQGVAIELERDGKIHGYPAGLGLFGHSVALSNEDLKILITGSSVIAEPGFLYLQEIEIITWLLEQGFKIQWLLRDRYQLL
jgi:hypothetical protein